MITKLAAIPKIYVAKAFASSATGQCDCSDCDCACAEPAIPPMTSFEPSQKWRRAENIFFNSFYSEYRLAFNVDNPVQPAVINYSAYALLNSMKKPFSLADIYGISPDLPRPLVDEVCAKFLYLKLIEPLEASNVEATRHLMQSPLIAWLHLTDRCNLRCAYCYLPHAPVDMTLEVGYAAIQATYRSALAHGYRKVKFKYAGGEPLLRFDTLLALHRYALEYGSQFGLEIEGVVLSNGVLLSEDKARTLKENGLRLMISLDGIEAYHNSQRFHADGRGSFEEVARAIDVARTQGLTPDISITVSNQNAAGLGNLMKWILEHDLPFSINFFRRSDLSSSKLEFEEETIINGMRAAFDVIETNLPRRSILPSLLDRANLSTPHRHTCGVGNSYMVFSPQGGVAKCQMQIQHTVATTRLPDPLALVRTDIQGIQNLDVESKEECNSCQWRYWCTGGCPLETYRVTGSYSAKSPNCNIYKSLFVRALKLEGLRLLTYENNDLPV